ncbi:MAG: DUF928 domain-containing protein [Phormidesmis sp.]
MNYRFSFALRAIVTLSTLSLAALALRPLSATAQPLPPMPIQFNPDSLTNPGRPGGRRRGGGSRGICQGELPLTAIAYASPHTVEELGITQTVEVVGMLTTQIQPTLWFYLPEPLTDGATTEFVMKDGGDQLLYSGQLTGTTDNSGIVGVPVPISLEPEAAYHWFLTVDCDENERAVIDGWIERQLPDLALSNLLAQANPRNRAALYANAGFLQDALSELAAIRLANLEDEAIAQDWVSFLRALDLPELTVASLLDCCQVGSAPVPETAIEVNEAADDVAPEQREAADTPDEPAAIERASDRDGSLPRDR